MTRYAQQAHFSVTKDDLVNEIREYINNAEVKNGSPKSELKSLNKLSFDDLDKIYNALVL